MLGLLGHRGPTRLLQERRKTREHRGEAAGRRKVRKQRVRRHNLLRRETIVRRVAIASGVVPVVDGGDGLGIQAQRRR